MLTAADPTLYNATPGPRRTGSGLPPIPSSLSGVTSYLDARLILRKLEARSLDGKLRNDKPEERFTGKLIEKHNVEGLVFTAATGLVPTGRQGSEVRRR